MTRDHLLSFAIGGSAVLATLLYAADADGGVRQVVAVAFLVIGPGLAFVRLLGLRDPLSLLTLAVGGSIGLNVVIGTILLALNVWTPGRMIVILTMFTIACVMLRQTMHPDMEPERRGPSARQRAMAALTGVEPDGSEA